MGKTIEDLESVVKRSFLVIEACAEITKLLEDTVVTECNEQLVKALSKHVATCYEVDKLLKHAQYILDFLKRPACVELAGEISQKVEQAAQLDLPAETFKTMYRAIRRRAPQGNLHICLRIYVPTKPAEPTEEDIISFAVKQQAQTTRELLKKKVDDDAT